MHPSASAVAVLLVLVIYFIVQLLSFLTIFFPSKHAGTLITQVEVKAAHEARAPDTRPQYIPKIIHQVYHDWSGNDSAVPSDWDEVRQTCKEKNRDWDYKVQTLYTVDAEKVLLLLHQACKLRD